MARPERNTVVPYLAIKNSVYKLRWTMRKNSKKIEFQLTLGKITKQKAHLICAAATTAFAGKAEFPEEIRNDPSIKRYTAITNDLETNITDAILIQKYITHKKRNSASAWPITVNLFLTKALAHMETLQNATYFRIQDYLDCILDSCTPATRNRAAASLSGFYKWLRETGYAPATFNPMKKIKRLREDRPPNGIVAWEANEIPLLLKMARDRKDGIAIWIAILAGLRRAEIARLDWTCITHSYIIVEKSKTGKKRQVPMSTALYKELQEFRKNPLSYGIHNDELTRTQKQRQTDWLKEYHKSNRVVPWPNSEYGWQTAAKRLVEKFLPRLLPDIHKSEPEKFGWNPFRHTFASRHVQAGIPISLVAAWIGDRESTCLEHYARFVPKNMRDKRIDDADPDIAI